MREVDDKIVYTLNTSIPTESFKGQLNASVKCTDLYGKLNETYDSRNKIIKNCIATTANRVKGLKVKKDDNPDDISVYKDFKWEQRKVHELLKNQYVFFLYFMNSTAETQFLSSIYSSCDCCNPN